MSEIVLDANILVRLLTDDPPQLANRVEALLDSAERVRVDSVIAPITVAEVVYVLGSVYHWSRENIVVGLLALLASSRLVFLERDVIQQALMWYRQIRQVHFADAYVGALALARGHGNVMSLDRDFRRLAGITIIDDPSQFERN